MVTVTISSNTAKALTSFRFATLAVEGTINETAKTVAVTVPYGTNVTALVATFASTGSSVKIAGVSQVSGVTANNFTNPVAYTVTAADNSTQDYVVTVTIAPYVFTVTFDGQGATVGPNPLTKTVTAPATTVGTLPTEPKKSGFTFGGWWTIDGTQFFVNTVVNANITVSAKWIAIPKSTVTFYDDSATTPVSPSIITVTTNSTLGALPTAPKKEKLYF